MLGRNTKRELEGKGRDLGVGELVVKQEIGGFRAIYFWLGRGGTAHPPSTPWQAT